MVNPEEPTIQIELKSNPTEKQEEEKPPVKSKKSQPEPKIENDEFRHPKKTTKRQKTDHTAPPIETKNSYDVLETKTEEKMEEEEATEFTPQPSTSNSTPRVSDKTNTTQNTNTETRKTHKIAPIIITDKDKWAYIRQILKTHNINTVQNKLVKPGIHIEPKTDEDYRKLKHILDNEQIQFYTFQLRSEKTLKVVMRGIPTFITDTDITDDLTDQGYPTIKIKRMNGKHGIPAPLVLIELTRQYKSIYNIHDCCGLTIKIEPLNKRTDIIQCHKCQTFGHHQRNCNIHYKCMKCGDEHSTHLCTKPKTTPPKCANCGGPHLSTFLNCPNNPNNPVNKTTPKPEYIPAPPPTTNPWTQKQRNTTPNTTDELALALGNMLITLHSTNATTEQIQYFVTQTQKIITLYNNKH